MNNRKNRRFLGQSLIEFALLVPILISIIFGIIELSLLFYDDNIVTNASRSGARYGVIPLFPAYPTTTQVISYTQTFCNNNLISFSTTKPTATVTVQQSSSTPSPGATLTVTVSYVYTGLVLPTLINSGKPFNITSTTTMVYE